MGRCFLFFEGWNLVSEGSVFGSQFAGNLKVPRRRAQGKASRKFSVAAALFALNATVESALIPTVLRSFEQTQMKKHARPVADAELVHPGDTAGEQPSTKKRTLIDDLREGHYRTVEDAAPSTEQAPSGLRERALGIVRSIRQRAAKKTDR